MAASDIIFLGIGGPTGSEQIDAFMLFGLTVGNVPGASGGAISWGGGPGPLVIPVSELLEKREGKECVLLKHNAEKTNGFGRLLSE